MEQKFIDVKGIKVHYRTFGWGTSIVLLHASPRSGKFWKNDENKNWRNKRFRSCECRDI